MQRNKRLDSLDLDSKTLGKVKKAIANLNEEMFEKVFDHTKFNYRWGEFTSVAQVLSWAFLLFGSLGTTAPILGAMYGARQLIKNKAANERLATATHHANSMLTEKQEARKKALLKLFFLLMGEGNKDQTSLKFYLVKSICQSSEKSLDFFHYFSHYISDADRAIQFVEAFEEELKMQINEIIPNFHVQLITDLRNKYSQTTNEVNINEITLLRGLSAAGYRDATRLLLRIHSDKRYPGTYLSKVFETIMPFQERGKEVENLCNLLKKQGDAYGFFKGGTTYSERFLNAMNLFLGDEDDLVKSEAKDYLGKWSNHVAETFYTKQSLSPLHSGLANAGEFTVNDHILVLVICAMLDNDEYNMEKAETVCLKTFGNTICFDQAKEQATAIVQKYQKPNSELKDRDYQLATVQIIDQYQPNETVTDANMLITNTQTFIQEKGDEKEIDEHTVKLKPLGSLYPDPTAYHPNESKALLEGWIKKENTQKKIDDNIISSTNVTASNTFNLFKPKENELLKPQSPPSYQAFMAEKQEKERIERLRDKELEEAFDQDSSDNERGEEAPLIQLNQKEPANEDKNSKRLISTTGQTSKLFQPINSTLASKTNRTEKQQSQQNQKIAILL